jgi:hypothetical protein
MHFQPELNMGFDDLPHDMGISGDMSTVHCAEQDLYGLHTHESPIIAIVLARGPNPIFP